MMVPSVAPRNRCERSFTHSQKWLAPKFAGDCAAMWRISSQVALMFSQTSAVIRPRTAWALARAARRQL
ncbi:hypothetical protein D9M71_218210 [compost metagenome]